MEKPDYKLQEKLGLKPDQITFILNSPNNYEKKLPQAIPLSNANEINQNFDWLQVFYTNRSQLTKEIDQIKRKMSRHGQLWISWPKKSSKIKLDLSDDIVRDVGLSVGLVDVKIAAIDETWSGLKFVYRVKDR
jgi:hypothetical protein